MQQRRLIGIISKPLQYWLTRMRNYNICDSAQLDEADRECGGAYRVTLAREASEIRSRSQVQCCGLQFVPDDCHELR